MFPGGSMSFSKLAIASLLPLFSILLTGCSDGGGGNSGGAGVGPSPIVKVTRENYLSGKNFCSTYSDVTSREKGRYVQVPKDYNDPSKGTLEIYVYSMSAFDSSKPTYIYVDGGPGQNTHGLMPDYLEGRFNELRFDQRGLGCSAPETYDLYMDSTLYSTMNTIHDMDMIRKAYNISSWAIYGVSYGTVPATMYGSKFAASTKAVVLEGVVGSSEQMHDYAYKAEKLNIVLEGLTSAQQDAVGRLSTEDSDDANLIFDAALSYFYSEIGMRKFQTLLKRVISEDGTIDRELLKKWRTDDQAHSQGIKFAQRPGVTDQNIIAIIHCKDLDYRNAKKRRLRFTTSTNRFYTIESTADKDQQCNELNVPKSDEQPYRIADYNITAPTYYFQGSHDGATMAVGALSHWKTVPQGSSYFLLAQKGGHNPNLDRLDNTDYWIKQGQRKIFEKAVSGMPIVSKDIEQVNIYSSFDWILFLDPKNLNIVDFENELKGINKRLSLVTK